MYNIKINPLARQDLIDIKDYIIKEYEDINSANEIVLKIVESYEKLSQFPELGIELSSKINIGTNYRYLVTGSYIVFYKYDEEFIYIYRVLSSRRDYIKILFNE